ncbi:DUF6916 family protein [Stieleria varia]|uniref:DUF6916 domain-containing protein n=1 Tax=Stieleria varia TaxID=2528005 RepID=A0A5C6ARS1_9BACT|nr:hypothetical protein [Stieleria varia]TWU02400.1 hypothetical protein Pla52n_34500 [Stieleria varia]
MTQFQDNPSQEQHRPAPFEEQSGGAKATSRRGFLGCATAVGAVAALDHTASGAVMPVSPEQISAENFGSYVGETFYASSDCTPTHQLKLVSVKKHERKNLPQQFRDPFALLFRADSSTPLPQQACMLSKPGFGHVSALLVPVGVEDGSVLMEVCVN